MQPCKKSKIADAMHASAKNATCNCKVIVAYNWKAMTKMVLHDIELDIKCIACWYAHIVNNK